MPKCQIFIMNNIKIVIKKPMKTKVVLCSEWAAAALVLRMHLFPIATFFHLLIETTDEFVSDVLP